MARPGGAPTSRQVRLATLVSLAALVVVACVAYARHQITSDDRAERATSTDVALAPVPPATTPTAATTPSPGPDALPATTGPRIVFVHTGLDARYGLLAAVPLTAPGSARSFGTLGCDRVAAAQDGSLSCLQSVRGVPTLFQALDVDAAGTVDFATTLAGVPSWTRLSPDGTIVATTSFVQEQQTTTAAFDAATVVRRTGGGPTWGNLRRFALVVDGARVTPEDRVVSCVTLAGDDRTFYASVAAGGQNYLVRGDLRERRMTSVATGVECPALSPDGRRIGFKQVTQTVRDTTVRWTPAVLDLATGRRTVLTGEARSLDDQVEWLDDDTLLYAMTRTDSPGTSDVWALDTSAAAAPRLLVEQAASPSVVR